MSTRPGPAGGPRRAVPPCKGALAGAGPRDRRPPDSGRLGATNEDHRRCPIAAARRASSSLSEGEALSSSRVLECWGGLAARRWRPARRGDRDPARQPGRRGAGASRRGAMSSAVCGCVGALSSSTMPPRSTQLPSRRTSMVSESRATTARSCEMTTSASHSRARRWAISVRRRRATRPAPPGRPARLVELLKRA